MDASTFDCKNRVNSGIFKRMVGFVPESLYTDMWSMLDRCKSLVAICKDTNWEGTINPPL